MLVHLTGNATVLSRSLDDLQGRFVVNYHTNEIKGVGHDTLKTDAIMNELNELNALEKGIEEPESGESGKDEPLPALAKHFLVFICTTWSPTSKLG